MDLKTLINEPPLDKIQPKQNGNTIRYVTFNINGFNTLFKYHPWTNFNQDLNKVFQLLQADIITLQELKLSVANISSVKNIGHLTNYKSFISLPKVKKGYSGVGLFVRIPSVDELAAVRNNLCVVRAEEGVTGYLNGGDGVEYRDSKDNIGGYPNIDRDLGLLLDSEGRCVVIELRCNLVVFALYCPANSMATDEGETFRLEFLKALLSRCHTLKKQGKEVIIMGDINVSLDLIDSAEGISDRVKQNLVRNRPEGYGFETLNYEECLKFKSSKASRALLNSYTIPGIKYDLALKPNMGDSNQQFLYDTTRYVLGRKMNVYTVWNTLTNSRAINFGSRIDLILTSCPKLIQTVSNADIWPFILGSDHCPVFTDFDVVEETSVPLTEPTKLDFEARYYYKLYKSRDISLLFNSKRSTPSPSPILPSKEQTPDEQQSKKPKLQYVSRKTVQYVSRKPPAKLDNQKGITNFFNVN